jgi:hypothetical protein
MRAAAFAIEPIATREMLARVYAFDEHSYDTAGRRAGANIPFGLFEDWWHAWPTGFLCAVRGCEPQAVIGLFPVSHAWAGDFLAYRTSERELCAGDIAASDRRCWYFSGLSSNRRPGGLGLRVPCILGHALLRWSRINANAVGAETVTIVAEGTTPIGEKLLRGVFALGSASAPADGTQRPRFKATTDMAAVSRLLVENPFFSRCRGLREEALSPGALS